MGQSEPVRFSGLDRQARDCVVDYSQLPRGNGHGNNGWWMAHRKNYRLSHYAASSSGRWLFGRASGRNDDRACDDCEGSHLDDACYWRSGFRRRCHSRMARCPLDLGRKDRHCLDPYVPGCCAHRRHWICLCASRNSAFYSIRHSLQRAARA